MAPDYFSLMATDSLASVLPKWKKWALQAEATSVLTSATYPFPSIKPRFLGTIVQKYRIRDAQTPSAAFQSWIDNIELGVKNKLVPALEAADMMLPPEAYQAIGIAPYQPILQMSDFNGLIALSQKHKVPVFALSDDQLEQSGIVLERTKKSMGNFRQLFEQAADRIIKLTSYVDGH